MQSAVEVFRVLSISLDLDQMLNAVLNGLKSLIAYDAAGIYAIEPEPGRLRAQVVRYQPHALPDAKLSRVMLADFAQLTRVRSAVVTADPYHPRRLRVTISGIAPQGPPPEVASPPPNDRVTMPTLIELTVQQRDARALSESDWKQAPAATASITEEHDPKRPVLVRWTGTVEFTQTPVPDKFRLLIREYEYVSANYMRILTYREHENYCDREHLT